VAGKTVVVESPEPDPNYLPNRDARGDHKPEQTARLNVRGLRPVVENLSEIMNFVRTLRPGTLR
jgi:hypothetical protein